MPLAHLYISPYNGAAFDATVLKNTNIWRCPFTHRPLNAEAVERDNWNYGTPESGAAAKAHMLETVAVYEAEIKALIADVE